MLVSWLSNILFLCLTILIFDWCEKKLRSFDLILPGASATGKITNVAGAKGGGKHFDLWSERSELPEISQNFKAFFHTSQNLFCKVSIF